MLSGKYVVGFLLSLILSSSILLLFSRDVRSSSENKDSFTEATLTLFPIRTKVPIPGKTDTPTPIDSDHMPVLFGMNITSTATPAISNETPTREPTKTPPAIPGQTDTPTPVDSDYMPALFAMKSTPTATPTVSLEMPTGGPSSTTISLPH